MKDYFVYKICFDECKDIYVGITTDLYKRYKQHLHSADKGIQTSLYKRIRRYGMRNTKIKVLERLENHTILMAQDREQKIIQELNPELNKAIRRVKNIGYHAYKIDWIEKNRLGGSYRCNVCDLNCGYATQLVNHLKTKKHKKNTLIFQSRQFMIRNYNDLDYYR